MKRFLLLAALVMSAAHASIPRGSIAIKGKLIYTMVGAPIKNGVVLIENGKIVKVGPADQVTIPAGVPIKAADVVTPGLIDARATVGLTGILNSQGSDQDQLETSGPMQPELRALDAYNPQERLIGYLASFGITTANTGHAPGQLISGQTMIVKLTGNTSDEAAIVPEAMVSATLDPSAAGKPGAPGNRSKQVSMLREAFLKAQEAMKVADKADAAVKVGAAAKGDPKVNLRQDMLIRVLKRELPLLVYADRAQDIVNALRIAKEFNLRLILDGAAEAFLVMDEIKAAGVPVIVHPSMERATGEAENLSFENASRLSKAGIPIAIQSGYEGYVPKVRVVLFEAAIAASNGLGFDGALKAITIDAAALLGISNRVGSLEVGKDGDVAMYDGDPFEYTTHCVGTVIEGTVVSSVIR